MSKRPATFPKFWNIATNPADGSGTIDLDGELVEVRPKDICGDVKDGVYYTNDDFKADLEACKGLQHVTVNINSFGGDLFLGIAIHNALKALPCKVTTVIRGMAASAASVVFCAGSERLVYPGSVLMIHGVSSLLDFFGFVNEHECTELISRVKAFKRSIQTMNAAMANIYAATTGKGSDECLALISDDSELYMTGEEAISGGWATGYAQDGYQPQLRMVARADKTLLYSGSRLLSEDWHAPDRVADLGILPGTENSNSNTMNEENTTPPQDVGNGAPVADTVPAAAETTADAIRADRARIAKIDALAARMGGAVSADLVTAAKYGTDGKDAMTPEAFAMAALEAMPADRFATSGHASARAAELAQNAVPVAVPPAPSKDMPAADSPEARRASILAKIDKAAGGKPRSSPCLHPRQD